MFNSTYHVVGVMSGTSLDGIDLAELKLIRQNDCWHYQILACETVSYAAFWLNKLKAAVNFSDEALKQLNFEYTQLLGETILNFIKKHDLTHLDAICSHGHTILHQPQNGITLQIGNLPDLSKIVQQKVVCNFRIQDVQLGGQGAPLVPVGDALLFGKYTYCLNLGGFSNISFQENNQRVAFDIAPVNTVLNYFSNQLGFEFDNKGTLSKSGTLHLKLLNKLNEMAFYQKKHPKSLGIEFVNSKVMPILNSFAGSCEDKMRTFTEHTAFQIAKALPTQEGILLATGGGVYNTFLMERIGFYLPKMTVEIPDSKLLEYKEALIFGLLGVLKLRGEINIFQSVTGASKNHCSGVVFDY